MIESRAPAMAVLGVAAVLSRDGGVSVTAEHWPGEGLARVTGCKT